ACIRTRSRGIDDPVTRAQLAGTVDHDTVARRDAFDDLGLAGAARADGHPRLLDAAVVLDPVDEGRLPDLDHGDFRYQQRLPGRALHFDGDEHARAQFTLRVGKIRAHHHRT